MIHSFLAAFSDVFSKKIRGLLVLSLISATILLLGLFFGLTAVFTHFVSFDSVWLTKTVNVLGGIGFFILALMFFPAAATFAAGFFIDCGVDKLSQGRKLRDVKLADSVKMSSIVALQGAGATALITPISVLLGWIPLLNLLPVALYYWVNGRILAREYFFSVALRTNDYASAEKLFEQKLPYWRKAGILIAVLMTIPVVNMISPLVAVAFMRRLVAKQEDTQ